MAHTKTMAKRTDNKGKLPPLVPHRKPETWWGTTTRNIPSEVPYATSSKQEEGWITMEVIVQHV